MTQSNNNHLLSFLAGADLSAKQYFIVKNDTGSNEVVLAAAAADSIVGVLQNAPVENQEALVAVGGTCKVIAAGDISKGAWVTSDGNGEAVATTTAGNLVIGQALQSAVDGDIFEILLTKFHHKA